MKTSELQGAALDWAVATALKLPPQYFNGNLAPLFSSDWSQGGPIIERENICLSVGLGDEGLMWAAYAGLARSKIQTAKTPLIAAMRCYVASKLGDEVEIPEELK